MGDASGRDAVPRERWGPPGRMVIDGPGVLSRLVDKR